MRIEWREWATSVLKTPKSAIVIDAIHDQILETWRRTQVAAESYYGSTAGREALELLCADAFLPSYDGEDLGEMRNRYAWRNRILDSASTLRAVTRIASLYFPQSDRVFAFNRRAHWAELDTVGVIATGVDWDSTYYPSLYDVPERFSDVFLVIEGPHPFAFSSGLWGEPLEDVGQPLITIGTTGSASLPSRVTAMSTALRAYTSAFAVVRECVFVNPTPPTRTYFDPLNPLSTMPIGQFGKVSMQPDVHRYTGPLT